MSQATSSTLSVAITCDRTGYLSKSEALWISRLIYRQIASEANSDSDTPGPIFSSEQLYADRAIKLWCANDQTLTWLKKTVSGLNIRNKELVVKNQSEIQKRVNCKLQIPSEQRDTYEHRLDDIKQVLCYQNPWFDLKKCALSGERDNNFDFYKVMMEIPEDLIPTLMKAERRLSFGSTVVYVDFEGPDGELNSDVPKGWDPVTETIL